ncbi:ADP-ribosylation factor-like protein 6-interacting protein 1 [Papilio xuthus]|nr:ADP-ribosylation factor-like protein 6-interacting protein 1 [Papilio xuthus]
MAIVGLFINFIDFLVPIICNSIYTPSYWTGQKEKMFEDICRSLVSYYNKILQNISTFYSLRETSPCVYYIISISVSLTLAWMASAINNIFLLYIFSTVMLLWPGIQHRGIFNTMLSMLHLAPRTSPFKTE